MPDLYMLPFVKPKNTAFAMENLGPKQRLQLLDEPERNPVVSLPRSIYVSAECGNSYIAWLVRYQTIPLLCQACQDSWSLSMYSVFATGRKPLKEVALLPVYAPIFSK